MSRKIAVSIGDDNYKKTVCGDCDFGGVHGKCGIYKKHRESDNRLWYLRLPECIAAEIKGGKECA